MAKRHLILGIVATFFLIILFFIVTYSISTIAGKKAPVFSDRVALIRVEGIILDSRETIEQLKRYGKDNSVKAIVLRVDSPGGGVVPSLGSPSPSLRWACASERSARSRA